MAAAENDFDRVRRENANSQPERLRPAESEQKIHREWLKENKG